ncbi:MAG: InlB B-repeat-containing protein, partial [Campylobacteraceae bacterium]|nr:InlB B-repeat-containing protein [Campylobacteraceae bacterium]
IFTGWQEVGGSETIAIDATSYTLTKDIIFKAQYIYDNVVYTATFLDYDDNVVDTLSAERYSSIILPSAPIKADYTFIGWLMGKTGVTIASGEAVFLTQNTIFKAQYTFDNRTITFLDYDDRVITTQSAKQGSYIAVPTPTKTGYTFTGWQEVGGSETIAPGEISYYLLQNITFKAQYTLDEESYTVSFYDKNLDFLGSETVVISGSIDLDDKKAKYGVAQWYEVGYTSVADAIFTPVKDSYFCAIDGVTLVSTQDELAAIAPVIALGKKYILTNDIELDDNGAGFDADGWQPIGDSSLNMFSGIFNGNGHKITNLWINRTIENTAVGLFGYVNGTVKNLGVELNNDKGGISGYDYVGGLVGNVRLGILVKSYAIGNVNGHMRVGGLAGNVYRGTVTNSYSIGDVSGEYKYVGGLAGSISGVISNSYSIGNVSGVSEVGGIVGSIGVSGKVINSYSTGNVSGEMDVGGIAGWVAGGTLNSSYAAGSVEAFGYLGGMVGGTGDECTITNNAAINPSVSSAANPTERFYINRANGYIGYSYEDKTVISNNFARSALTDVVIDFTEFVDGNKHSGIGKTDDAFKLQTTYSNIPTNGGLGWKFGDNDTNPWKIDPYKNGGLPYLYWENR